MTSYTNQYLLNGSDCELYVVGTVVTPLEDYVICLAHSPNHKVTHIQAWTEAALEEYDYKVGAEFYPLWLDDLPDTLQDVVR